MDMYAKFGNLNNSNWPKMQMFSPLSVGLDMICDQDLDYEGFDTDRTPSRS